MRHRLLGSSRIIKPLWKLVVAAALALVLFVVIINGIKSPVDAPTGAYTAEFADASGLRPNADVRIRGVKVGKVTSIDLSQNGDNVAVATVRFTLADNHHLTDKSTVAVKYANLSGVRYLDVSGADGAGTQVRDLGVDNTIGSFDITELFNGLQPALQTLSPQEINEFSNNAVTVMQGDGSGLGPMLESINTLSRYTADRSKIISTLVTNMSRISETLGGRSPQIIEFLRDIERPVDSTLTVLDEFRKASLYGPAFTGTVNSILSGLGIEPSTDIDGELSKVFPTVDSLWKSLQLLPTVFEGLQVPASSSTNTCSHGQLPLPALGKVLINGSGVIVCRN